MLDLGHTCAGMYEADNKELAQSIADKFNIELTDDMESLLAPEVSVVGCASINNEKIDIIEKCEERGIDIMVDKPLVTNWEDFKRVEERSEERRVGKECRTRWW